MVPINGVALESEQLSQMFSAPSRPTASLAFEAPVDVDLDIPSNHATAAAYRCELKFDGTAQPCWNNMPVVMISVRGSLPFYWNWEGKVPK
jgi:hypothetical protein